MAKLCVRPTAITPLTAVIGITTTRTSHQQTSASFLLAFFEYLLQPIILTFNYKMTTLVFKEIITATLVNIQYFNLKFSKFAKIT